MDGWTDGRRERHNMTGLRQAYKNVGGVMILFLSTSSDGGLYLQSLMKIFMTVLKL